MAPFDVIVKAQLGLARLYLCVKQPVLAASALAQAETLVEDITSPSAFLSCTLHLDALKRSALWLPDGVDDGTEPELV